MPHPIDNNKPLFILFKNIFNNFQRKKLFSFHNESHFKHANFSHIEQLYDLEADKPLRVAHKLKPVVLNPNNLQRTSVKLASAIFHDSTIRALKLYSSDSEHVEWAETAEFLHFIKKIWNFFTC